MINDLKIGEVKELLSLFSNLNGANSIAESTDNNLYSRYIGKYVIVRSRNEGVNAGFVVDAGKSGIILKEARRLYYHKPLNKDQSWYEGVANTGISLDSKISAPVEEKAIIEDYSIILCSAVAQKSISGFKSHEQS